MKSVRLYSKEDCHLCEEAQVILDAVAARLPLEVQVVDIEQDPVLHKLFMEHIPVVDVDGRRLYWPFTADDVLQALNPTASGPAPETTRPAVSGRARDMVIFADKLIYHFAKHWIPVVGFFMGVYAGLPWLAPVLLARGYAGPANLIYFAYRFSCHQLPSRSFFIFGQQAAYCHRDTAIYTSLFLAIILFAFVRRWVKPLPLRAYALFLLPMAVDGLTQLVGLRTSNWQLRAVTGALFGVGSAWLALPYLEEAFQDIRRSASQHVHLD